MKRVFLAFAMVAMLASVAFTAANNAKAGDCGPAFLTCADTAMPFGDNPVTITVGSVFEVNVSKWANVSYLFHDDAADHVSGQDAVSLVKEMQASDGFGEVTTRFCWNNTQWAVTKSFDAWSEHVGALLDNVHPGDWGIINGQCFRNGPSRP